MHEASILEFIDTYNSQLAESKFSTSNLYNALIGLSKARWAVDNPPMKKTPMRPAGSTRRLFKSDYVKIEMRTSMTFIAGWNTYLSLQLLQRFGGSCLKFAIKNDLQNLQTVIKQVRHLKLPKLTIDKNITICTTLQEHVKQIKRVDAAIDDIVAYIFKKKYGDVNYVCERQGSTRDASFNCKRELDAPTFSLIINGPTTDAPLKPESFYSLFKHDTFDELIADLQEYFAKVA